MADPLLPADLQALRTTLAHLAARSHTAAPADLTPRLRALGAAADALGYLLRDPAIVAVLSAAPVPSLDLAPLAADHTLLSADPQSSVLSPQSSDPDWDTLAPGPQTAAQRHDVFALLLRLDWPVPRIVNVLHKHTPITASDAQAAVDLIATLDGRTTHALLGYLAGHWRKAQGRTPG